MPVACLAAVALVARTAWQGRPMATFHAGLVAGTLAASWGSALLGGDTNVLMPAFAAPAISNPRET